MNNSETVLDIVNILIDDLKEKESFLVMYNNPSEGSAIFAINGESLSIQAILSKGYMNHDDKSKETLSDIKNFIVNACVLLCNENEHVKDAVINSIIKSNTKPKWIK
jgi:hypothetical protein